MDVRNALYRHILGQSARFFAQRTTGQLMSRVNNDVGQVQQAVSETAGDLARESLALIGYARAAVLLRRVAGGLLLHQRAADRLPARPPRAARPADDAPQPGGARAVVARQRRSVHGAPDRESVWKRRHRKPRSSPAPARVSIART